jgi:hypothetical protein
VSRRSHGVAEVVARPRSERPRGGGAAQRPRRSVERALEPGVEDAVEQSALLLYVGHRRAGRRRLRRALVQQVAAEAVDRADAREFELAERDD